MKTKLSTHHGSDSAAKQLAGRDRQTIKAVLPKPVRKDFAISRSAAQAERNGIPLLAQKKSAEQITLDLVNHLRD
jgi:hypothetical protein